MKVVEYDIEGSLSEKGYDMDTEDEVERGNMSLKGRIRCNSQKKNKKDDGSDFNQDRNFVEELKRGSQKKGSSGKGLGISGHNEDRVSVPSDDEFLIHNMERKRKLMRI